MDNFKPWMTVELPSYLKIAIEEKISKIKLRTLANFSEKLSSRYRNNKKSHGSFMHSEEEHLAYLTARVPATFAANCHVLKALKEKIPYLSIESLLDVGAGPGTATFAAKEIFTEISKVTLIEKDRGLIALGKSLTNSSFNWLIKDLEKERVFAPHQLVVMSYALGELSEKIWKELVENLWKAAEKILIIIEPGTPAGFLRISKVRDFLIALDASLIAPCPHQKKCPLAKNDWCHFSQRISRTHAHRKIKKGQLGYEDEKFSYLVFSKEKICLSEPRIIRHPKKFPKQIHLTLCTHAGIERKIISKSEKVNYANARKASWGSLLKLNTLEVE
jgi:ribosomal protein RSM22 (predicted rRNA methylase)